LVLPDGEKLNRHRSRTGGPTGHVDLYYVPIEARDIEPMRLSGREIVVGADGKIARAAIAKERSDTATPRIAIDGAYA
jgi:hypothetical protein